MDASGGRAPCVGSRPPAGCTSLDRRADGRQDLGDLAAQEDQGDDRDDRDEREDQRVLGETLALLLVTREERRDECVEVLHVEITSFPAGVSRPCRRPAAKVGVRRAGVNTANSASVQGVDRRRYWSGPSSAQLGRVWSACWRAAPSSRA